MAGTIERRIVELGFSLPQVPPPVGSYVPSAIAGNLLYTSGSTPRSADGIWISGKVGLDVTPEEAYKHAQLVGLQVLAIVREALGDLDRVKRIVKVLGMVNAVPEFTQFPKVINGCSDLFIQVFGEAGKHARSAVGMAGLPDNAPVEIEVIIEFA